MKLHLLNTEGKSGGTISPATHVVVTEQFLGNAGASKTEWFTRKSCDCLGSYKKVN